VGGYWKAFTLATSSTGEARSLCFAWLVRQAGSSAHWQEKLRKRARCPRQRAPCVACRVLWLHGAGRPRSAPAFMLITKPTLVNQSGRDLHANTGRGWWIPASPISGSTLLAQSMHFRNAIPSISVLNQNSPSSRRRGLPQSGDTTGSSSWSGASQDSSRPSCSW